MITLNGVCVKPANFPAGEQRITLSNNIFTDKDNNVTWRYKSDDELVTMIYLVGHIKNNGGKLGSLYMPYCPNARMDRVKDSREVFTLKYFCEVVNSFGFNRVYIEDAHSDVCVSLINNCKNIKADYTIAKLIKELGLKEEYDYIFYPDNGCAKKYEGVIQFPYLVGHKVRDWASGKIKSLDIIGEAPNQSFNILIVDDICSYGGTFLHSAKALKELGANKIYLYVTHCENSIIAGELYTSGLIDHIYTTDSIYSCDSDLITVLDRDIY